MGGLPGPRTPASSEGNPSGRPGYLVLLWLRPHGGAGTGEKPSHGAQAQSLLPGRLCLPWLCFPHLRSLMVWTPLGGRDPSTRRPGAPSGGLETKFALELTRMVTWAFTASFHSPNLHFLCFISTSTLYLPLVLAISLLHQGSLGPHASAPSGRRPGVRAAGGLPVISKPSQDCHVGLCRVCTAQGHCLQGSWFTL